MEDWTEHGLEDLREGIIRTPLPPEQTFLDGEHLHLMAQWCALCYVACS